MSNEKIIHETKLVAISIYLSPQKIKKLAGKMLPSLLAQFDNSGNVRRFSALVGGVGIDIASKNQGEKSDHVVYHYSNGLATSSKNASEAIEFLKPLFK